VSEDSTADLTVRMFGPFEVCLYGVPLPPLRTRKGQWLFALLALRCGHAVDRDWLAGSFWLESTRPRALLNLRSCLADLRRALGVEAGRLRSPTSRTLMLDLDGVPVDVRDFDQSIARGDLTSLERAVALYRGPLLEECDQEWAFQERLQREQAFLRALEGLAGHAHERGDAPAVEEYLRRAVAVDPLHETAHRSLMQALAHTGNHAAAFQIYRELRERLHRELNAAPDPETEALFREIQRHCAARKARAGGRPGRGAAIISPSSGSRSSAGSRS
jgi:DNA-binding SARP family transcriptional activator